MKKLQTALYITLMVALLAGCTNQAAIQQATATAEAHSTAVALLAQQVQQTGTAQAIAEQATAESLAATVSAESTQEAAEEAAGKTATVQAQDTATAVFRATSTADAQATSTAQAAATATARVVISRTETARKIMEATSTAQPMMDIVTKLKEDGFLKATDGTFYQIEDFDESWAQRGWYMFFETGYSPTDFVLSVDTDVETADKYAEGSGCGFVFHDRSTSTKMNHYMIWLDTAGYAVLGRMYNSDWKVLMYKKTSLQEATTQKAHIDLVVENNYITYFVNGEKTLRWQDATHTEGEFFLTLVSGTNKDYGTHCKMSNIWLWFIK